MRQLEAIGHHVDKVELIVFGGTLTAYDPDYLRWFMKRCLDCLNGQTARDLEEAKLLAESAPRRVSNIVFETRPDWCKERHVDLLLELGTTRVEIGAQAPDDEIYRIIKRGHTVGDLVEATRIAKDAGFVVSYHMMLGLPGSSPEKDLEMFRKIFEDPQFRPDGIKIYPTMVLPGTELYEWWKSGRYAPYPQETLVELIIRIKQMVPEWVRIHRILRDIPLNLTVAGVERGDLRNVVRKEMEKRGLRCKCIRCREIGHVIYRTGKIPEGDLELRVNEYEANLGREYFVTIEKGDALVGMLRLRIPSERAHRKEVQNAGVVRQLHVFGPMVPVGQKPSELQWQHRGIGTALMRKAEEICLEQECKKMVVLSGLGVKDYYRRLGFEREGPYMSKKL